MISSSRAKELIHHAALHGDTIGLEPRYSCRENNCGYTARSQPPTLKQAKGVHASSMLLVMGGKFDELVTVTEKNTVSWLSCFPAAENKLNRWTNARPGHAARCICEPIQLASQQSEADSTLGEVKVLANPGSPKMCITYSLHHGKTKKEIYIGSEVETRPFDHFYSARADTYSATSHTTKASTTGLTRSRSISVLLSVSTTTSTPTLSSFRISSL